MSANQKPIAEQKPHGQRWLTRLIPLLVSAIIGAMLTGGGIWLSVHHWGHLGRERAEKPKTIYQCPMHPNVTSEHPGDCPICGMKLKPMEPTGKDSAPTRERKIAFYRNPMDPKQTSPVPMKDEMGMDYIPVYEDELSGAGAEVPGLATVIIDPARQQLIGLRTAKVTRGPVSGSWRTVGSVQVDPRRVRRINVKVEGFVERIYVNFPGQPVKRGQALFSLYSPSLLATQNEYLIALKTRDALAQSGSKSEVGESLVASARRKLELWDVPMSEIKRLERTGKPSKSLTFYSPISGVVTAKNITEGSALNPGDTPYEITDLSVVWVLADAYESDLQRVKLKMPAVLTLAAIPDQTFRGVVEFIDPVLNVETRTAKVRMSFPNPDGALKPGMYGEVTLQGETREALRIPFDAVIQSGTKNVVFLALGEGRFQPVEVQLGVKDSDQVEVKNGLQEGQEVVTRANFLIDSESQLRASLSAMGEH